MNYLKISNSKLSVEEITDLVAHETCGAIASFIGTTRDSFEDKKVLSLEYQAYESMATKTMNEICNEIREKWTDVKHIAIYHRTGLVPVKEASVVIAISSPHRQSSLQSVQFAIDELKKNVPIWKKEVYENDESAWKENKESKIGGYQKTPAKRPKLEFDNCEVETNSIPNNLIQINADETEVARRIQCFVAKKREEIDLNNVLDFLDRKPEASEEENTCARVNSVVIRNKDSKGHLTVRRVKNEIGPQVKHEYKNTLDKLMEHKPISNLDLNPTDLPQSINERLENAEKYLKLDSNSTKNVFGRLKQIEDKILFMETISPEYHHFVGEKTVVPVSSYQQKKTYSLDDLDNLIATVKHKIDRK